MIGDTQIDIQTGANAGLTTIAAAYGFESEALPQTSYPDCLSHASPELRVIVA